MNGYYRQGLQGDALILSDNDTLYRFSPENGVWQSLFSDEGGFAALISEDALVVTYNDSGFGSPA